MLVFGGVPQHPLSMNPGYETWSWSTFLQGWESFLNCGITGLPLSRGKCVFFPTTCRKGQTCTQSHSLLGCRRCNSTSTCPSCFLQSLLLSKDIQGTFYNPPFPVTEITIRWRGWSDHSWFIDHPSNHQPRNCVQAIKGYLHSLLCYVFKLLLDSRFPYLKVINHISHNSDKW